MDENETVEGVETAEGVEAVETDEGAKKVFNKKWIGICLLVFIFATTFGIGPFGINLYKAEVSKDEVAYSLNNLALNFDAHLYKFMYYFEDQYWDSHSYGGASETTSANVSEIELVVNEEITAYEGNYFLPFYKNYKVKYIASLNKDVFSDTVVTSNQYAAKVEGTLNIKILGLCTLSKAKSIGKESVMNSVKEYFNNQMNNAMSRP